MDKRMQEIWKELLAVEPPRFWSSFPMQTVRFAEEVVFSFELLCFQNLVW